MEDIWGLICTGVILISIASWIYDKFNKRRESSPTTGTAPRGSTRSYVAPRSPSRSRVRGGKYYRPSSSRSSSKIKFGSAAGGKSAIAYHEIKDLVDALSGAPLDPAQGLHRCPHCRVFYNSHSVEVIKAENQGRCVSCLKTGIVSVSPTKTGRNVDPSVITLANYRDYVGRVITFQGLVHAVRVSQRGKDYAVMFENRPWVRGFKMVVFGGDVNRVGGRGFILGLENKTVRVRGVLVDHETFGYEIIVSEPEMILSVQ